MTDELRSNPEVWAAFYRDGLNLMQLAERFGGSPYSYSPWIYKPLLNAERIKTAEGAEITRLQALLNTPELHDFAKAVVLEAAHQRERWGAAHDAGKTAPDWFWLLGYLGGKALQSHLAGDVEKALHHIVATAAAACNWHAAVDGSSTAMRPGIAADKAPPCS